MQDSPSLLPISSSALKQGGLPGERTERCGTVRDRNFPVTRGIHTDQECKSTPIFKNPAVTATKSQRQEVNRVAHTASNHQVHVRAEDDRRTCRRHGPFRDAQRRQGAVLCAGNNTALRSPALQTQTHPWKETSCLWLPEVEVRRRWHPTPVLSPGKSHGPRSLVGCSPWGR